MIDNTLAQKKYKLINDFILNENNIKKFRDLDTQLITRRFDLVKDFSFIEQILTLDNSNLKTEEITDLLNDFLDKTNITKRNLFDIIKLSNLSNIKISEILLPKQLSELCGKIENVSRETKQMSFDFSILKFLDNFIPRLKDNSLKKIYKNTKIKIINKLVSFNYVNQETEDDYVYLCWIDKILFTTMQREINIHDFIKICYKILSVANNNLAVYWKILYSVNYIYLHADLSDIKELRKFRIYILKEIIKISNNQNINQIDIEKILINTLALPTINKENFYYIFNSIKKLADKSINDKDFCLFIIEYLIYKNSKQYIFKNRFIREAFIGMFFDILKNDDPLQIKEKELLILFKLYHIDAFFFYNKKDIIDKISSLVCSINMQNDRLFDCKFYKYCDIADFIFAKNRDIVPLYFNNSLDIFKKDYKKIYKRFSLYSS